MREGGGEHFVQNELTMSDFEVFLSELLFRQLLFVIEAPGAVQNSLVRRFHHNQTQHLLDWKVKVHFVFKVASLINLWMSAAAGN